MTLPGVIRAELLDTVRLGEGYAIFANTLQHPSNNCNALLGGETMMMSKEHFIEEFGVPRATLSVGCSGGSYTSLQYGDTFPGLIDGVLIACTFPDAMAIAFSGSDGHLLTHYFTATNPACNTCSRSGEFKTWRSICRQGPHHSAWKCNRTGRFSVLA